MKRKLSVVGAAAVTGLLVVTLFPVLLLATGPTGGTCGVVANASTGAIAATIRQIESGNDYTVRSSGSSASGAYEFLDSSWAGYGGYPRAYLAPPEVQDAKASENINAILAANNNDPAAVGVSWYIGHVPLPGSAEWDVVPSPGAGNRLTPRQYQTKWMDIYRTKLNPSAVTTVAGSSGTTATATVASPCSTGPLATSGDYALPVERSWYDQHPEWFTKPHHDYPAADIPVPIGTPVFAAAAGMVVSTTTSGTCGFGVVINGDDGAQYTYCHGLPNSQTVATGDKVLTSQRLMSSASTGNSTGPHLHFGIRIDGQDRCPQPFLVAIAEGLPLDPHGLPASGCSY
jgi:murein DD-endopeptidase MepM/ murein hydrolase activator NlpD